MVEQSKFLSVFLIILFIAGNLLAFSGRVAVTADGNEGDRDDIGATSLTLFMLARAGMQYKLVHYDFCSGLHGNNTEDENEMIISALDGADKFGYSRSLFFNAYRDPDTAVNHLKDRINESSSGNKLSVILAGTMDVFKMAIELSDSSKIQYVTLINHSEYNCCKPDNGAAKAYVISRGVNWIDIPDQNGGHSPIEGFKTEDMKYWTFLHKYRHGSWLYDRIDIVDDTDRWGETGDASDAGMMYYLLTGDEKGNVLKLKKWLDNLPQTVFPGSDWEEKSPESQNIDSEKLRSALKYLASVCGDDGIKRTVIIRNGYMVWRGNDIDSRHDVWSVSKSFTSTIFCLLIDDNKTTEDTPAKKYYSALNGHYPNVKLRHFATMTSGYTSTPTGPDSWNQRLRSIKPDVPAYAPPGSKNSYHDPAMTMFGYLLTLISDSSMRDMFKTRIADKIGMPSSGWLWNSWTSVNGKDVCYAHAGIFITARQLARFGHLYLNRGNWNGKQIISESWVDKATSLKVPLSVPWSGSGDDVGGQYGYNWWLNGIKRSGKRKWPNAPLKTFVAAGHNNNKCFVIPEWNMVIVRMGLDGNTVDDNEYSTFFSKISTALLN